MSMKFKVSNSVNASGKKFTKSVTIETEAQTTREQEVPAAKSGQLTTRTNASTGELTMAASHGIATGEKIDIYWEEAGVGGCRRNVTVGTVATNAVPISGGSGDDLPTNMTNITAMEPVVELFEIDGDNVKGIAVQTDAKGQFVFTEDDDDEITTFIFKQEEGADNWYDGGPDVNPLAGATVGKVKLSHGDAENAQIMRYTVAHD